MVLVVNKLVVGIRPFQCKIVVYEAFEIHNLVTPTREQIPPENLYPYVHLCPKDVGKGVSARILKPFLDDLNQTDYICLLVKFPWTEDLGGQKTMTILWTDYLASGPADKIEWILKAG